MILQPIMSEHVTYSKYSTYYLRVTCDQVMLSCDVDTCIDHVRYPTVTCHLIISNDNDFKIKRENGASVTESGWSAHHWNIEWTIYLGVKILSMVGPTWCQVVLIIY